MAAYQRHFFIGFISLLYCINSIAADVYLSVQADGALHFSSEPSAPGAALFSRGEVVAATPHKQRGRSIAATDKITGLIAHYAQQHAVDLALVRALVEVESRFQPTALSPKGAIGPMQLMPATARRYHVTDRFDLAQNIDAGIHYLKDLLILYRGNEALALASYNAGEGAVKRHGQRIPPYRETMLYVAAVLARAQAARTATTTLSGEVHANAVE